MGDVRDIGEQFSDQTFTLCGHGEDLTVRARWLHTQLRAEGSAIGPANPPVFEHRELLRLTLSDGDGAIVLKPEAVRDLMTFLQCFVEPHGHHMPMVVPRSLPKRR